MGAGVKLLICGLHSFTPSDWACASDRVNLVACLGEDLVAVDSTTSARVGEPCGEGIASAQSWLESID
jgi:hypothetical protein